MITTNKELMAQARQSLKGKWGMAVGAIFIYLLIVSCISMFGAGWDMITGAISDNALSKFSPISSLFSLLIGGPFALGIAIFSLSIARNDENAKMEQIFYGFKSFLKAFITSIIMYIFILLWILLLIIPGIIMGIAYSLTFFILSEEPEIKAIDAIRKSRKMMYGYKWKYFCLNLRFIGWGLLCIPTLGIGLLWLLPYVQVSLAKFYDDVKANPIEKES